MNCVVCELYISLGLQNHIFYTALIYQVEHEIVMPVLQYMSTFHKRKEKNREREREKGGGGGGKCEDEGFTESPAGTKS